MCSNLLVIFFFFFNDTATTEIYTLSLHDALPICGNLKPLGGGVEVAAGVVRGGVIFQADVSHGFTDAGEENCQANASSTNRSEEHTSELQSRSDIVCRLLLEKKKQNTA